jgi:hypothetical protein
MEDSKKSAFPLMNTNFHANGERTLELLETGLTKHEYVCIKLGIPDTGDESLDEVIRKSERKRISVMAMQGILSSSDEGNYGAGYYTSGGLVKTVMEITDELLKQLEQ